jgi:hypothetical protein
MIDQPPAQHGAECCSNGGSTGPGADGFAAGVLVERGADDRKAARHKECGTDTLHGTSRDELTDVARKAAPQRCRGEYYDPNGEHKPPAKPVPGCSSHQKQGSEKQRIGFDHPLDVQDARV